jgi:phosphatidylglycerol lysyltransferase
MLSKQTKIGVWTISLLTGLVGLINLLSAVTPSLPERVTWLKQIFPFEVRAGGHIFAAVSGFILLTLAANLLRRKRVAWLLTLCLLVVSIISHLIKGLDYEESLLPILLIVQLVIMQNVFTAQSDRPSIAQGIRVTLGALLFTLAYGTAGFFLMDRQYTTSFNLPQALFQTLAIFFTTDNLGLQPITRFARFFIDSIYIVGTITVSYGIFMLLRPVFLQTTTSSEERQQAQKIVEQYAGSSLAQFTLLEDKSYYFSASNSSFIAYVAKGRGAVVLGDPIGPLTERQEVILGFQQFCQQNDWYPAFYQTLPDHLEVYKSLGFKVVKIGEEGIVDLKTFTLQGKAGQHLRTAVNRMNKLGHKVKFYTPPLSQDLLNELKMVSDEWLKMMQGSEKKFSLGWFDEAYLQKCEIAVVQTSEGKISAFTNIISEYNINEITLDLMRRRIEVEKGTMDFLFISLFQEFKNRGYDGFNLGLSALSGVGQTQESQRLEKALNYLYEHLNRFYNFKGVHGFKEKFNPRWEPRYLIYPSLAALPEVVVALIRADSGDRLWDYFKPGS